MSSQMCFEWVCVCAVRFRLKYSVLWLQANGRERTNNKAADLLVHVRVVADPLIFTASTVFILWINLFLCLRWIEVIRGHILNSFLAPINCMIRWVSESWAEHRYSYTHTSYTQGGGLLVSHFSRWTVGVTSCESVGQPPVSNFHKLFVNYSIS